MPPLNDLLNADQIRIVNRGTNDEKVALINSFDPEKRQQLLRALPPQALMELPELGREAMALRQPQQFVNSELIENKLDRAIYSNRQLEEVLVDFWMNHFNVYNGKGQDRVLFDRTFSNATPSAPMSSDIFATCCWRQPAIRQCCSTWTTGNRRFPATINPFHRACDAPASTKTMAAGNNGIAHPRNQWRLYAG